MTSPSMEMRDKFEKLGRSDRYELKCGKQPKSKNSLNPDQAQHYVGPDLGQYGSAVAQWKSA